MRAVKGAHYVANGTSWIPLDNIPAICHKKKVPALPNALCVKI
jgi:hypothetical protein